MLDGQTENKEQVEGFEFRKAASEGNVVDLERFYSLEILDKAGQPSLQTALHRAAKGGHLQAVQWLCAKGANLNCKDKDSVLNTPVMYALLNKHHDVADFLIKNGCDIDDKNALGISARMIISEQSFPIPPLVLFSTNYAPTLSQSFIAHLPYLKSLGYKAFVYDFAGDRDFNEVVRFSGDMLVLKPQDMLYKTVNEIYSEVQKNTWLQTYATGSPILEQLFTFAYVTDQTTIGDKISKLAQQHNGGIICYLSFNEQMLLSLTIKNPERYIFFTEPNQNPSSLLNAFSQQFNLRTYGANPNIKLYDMSTAPGENEAKEMFRQPIQAYVNKHAVVRDYEPANSELSILESLKSICEKFEAGYDHRRNSVDALVPFQSSESKEMDELIDNLISLELTPKLCWSKMQPHNNERQLYLSVTNIENVKKKKSAQKKV